MNGLCKIDDDDDGEILKNMKYTKQFNERK